jgi:hypothetical protein
MITAVPPPDNDTTAHFVLSLPDVDELNALNRKILLRATLLDCVLDGQRSQGPGDDADFPMQSLLREACQELVFDIRIAAAGIAAVIERAKKGGA